MTPATQTRTASSTGRFRCFRNLWAAITRIRPWRRRVETEMRVVTCAMTRQLSAVEIASTSDYRVVRDCFNFHLRGECGQRCITQPVSEITRR